MKILLIIAGLLAVALANVYLSKRISCSFGSNIGIKHMKEQWGIDSE